MQELIFHVMNEWGYLGIALLIALENVFPPIPSEIILTFGGFMTTTTKMTITGVVISSTIGATIGAVILYLVGRLLTKERLYKLVDGRIGKLLRFKREDIDKSEKWFKNKGKLTVLFCRCIPIVRSLISIPAGITQMEFILFLVYTIVGTIVWNTIVTILGSVAGNAWESIANYINNFSKVILIILIIAIGIGVVLFYKKRKKSE